MAPAAAVAAAAGAEAGVEAAGAEFSTAPLSEAAVEPPDNGLALLTEAMAARPGERGIGAGGGARRGEADRGAPPPPAPSGPIGGDAFAARLAKQRKLLCRCFSLRVLMRALRSAARTASPIPSFICVISA